MKKILALFLGLIFVIFSLEIFLRIFFSIDKQRPIEISKLGKNSQQFNILFLGNSHTYGAGVEKDQAYPGLLTTFFNRNLKNSYYKVNIYNAGMLAANTTDIFNNIDRFAQEAQPNLTLIMAGEPNFWNKNGFGDFLSTQYGLNPSALQLFFLSLTKYSKSLTWIMNIKELANKTNIAAEKNIEIMIYKEVTLAEDHYIKRIEDNPLNRNTLANLNTFINNNINNPPQGIWRTVLYLYSRYTLYLNKDFKSVLQTVKNSISFDENTFDIFSYLIIQEIKELQILDSQEVQELDKIYKKLIQHPDYEGATRINQCIAYTLKSQREVLNNIKDQEKFLKDCQRMFPAFAVPAMGLRQLYLVKKNPALAHEALLKTMRANPFAQRDNIQKFFVEDAEIQNSNIKIKNDIFNFVHDFTEKFPSEAYVFDTKSEAKIYEWIEWDINRIQIKLRNKNIPLIIQNYHWIRDAKRGPKLNKHIYEISRNLHIPFIDTNNLFQKTVENSGEIETYFVQKFGINDSHPSEKGHRLISYIIYKNLVDQKLLPDELSHFNPDELLVPD